MLQLWQRWPEAFFSVHRNEIEQLLNLLGRPCDLVPPVFVHGPTATGKTSVVCEAMRVLRLPHAYVSCRSCHTSQLMYESILNQLVGQVRSATNNYSSARKCENLNDFAKHLPEACAQALSRKIALEKRLRSIRKVRDRLLRSLNKLRWSFSQYEWNR